MLTSPAMSLDLVFVLVTIGFFAVAVLYAAACDRV
jgi:hypothetical protein